MPFQAGFNKHATWTSDVEGGATTLCIKGWQVEDGGDIIDITSTCHAGKQAFISGIQRMNGSIDAFLDSGTMPSAIGIRFGNTGTLTVNTGGGFFTLHIIIEKVNYQSTVNGAVEFNFSYKSDADKAGAVVPSITYPA